jgi:hypothetical protein
MLCGSRDAVGRCKVRPRHVVLYSVTERPSRVAGGVTACFKDEMIIGFRSDVLEKRRRLAVLCLQDGRI